MNCTRTESLRSLYLRSMTKQHRRSYSLILSIIILIGMMVMGCQNTQDGMKSKKNEEKTIWVNSGRVPCEKDAKTNCLQVSDSKENPSWQILRNEIEDFRYVPGSVYGLKVQVLDANENGAKYRLIEIIEQEVDMKLRLSDIWVMREVYGKPLNADVQRMRPILEINMAKESISGNAPCNNYSGPIERVTETELVFGPIMATRRACEHLETEQMMIKALGETRSYQMEPMTLQFLDETGSTVIQFKKAH